MARNSGYSAAELMAMQRDAAERVRQMQRRARERMGESAPPSPPALPAAFPEHQRPLRPENAVPLPRPFAGDQDRLLLLLLFLLLSQENADPALLMALVFLML